MECSREFCSGTACLAEGDFSPNRLSLGGPGLKEVRRRTEKIGQKAPPSAKFDLINSPLCLPQVNIFSEKIKRKSVRMAEVNLKITCASQKPFWVGADERKLTSYANALKKGEVLLEKAKE